VTSIDGTQKDVLVTIHGTNDNPVLSVNQTNNTTGILTETDVDTHDTHTFDTTNGAGHFGSLTVDSASGAYAYNQNPSVANMNYDAKTHVYSGTEVFEVEVKDNHGGVDTKYITMNVTATVSAGNPPVITTQVTTRLPLHFRSSLYYRSMFTISIVIRIAT
jgi:VCBS repeat-containing protein